MSDIQNQIREVEVNIEDAKKFLNLRKALRNLSKNEDFKLLIDQHYFIDEASRLVLLKASQATQAEDSQQRIMQQIDAIGHLRQHFMFIEAYGDQAEVALRNDEETLAELRGESD